MNDAPNRQSMEKALKNQGYEHPSSETQQTSYCPYKVVNTDDNTSNFESANSYGDMYSSFSQEDEFQDLQNPQDAYHQQNPQSIQRTQRTQKTQRTPKTRKTQNK